MLAPVKPQAGQEAVALTKMDVVAKILQAYKHKEEG
jgi:hypothetical protein